MLNVTPASPVAFNATNGIPPATAQNPSQLTNQQVNVILEDITNEMEEYLHHHSVEVCRNSPRVGELMTHLELLPGNVSNYTFRH